MITGVLTSCGRHDLLVATLESFFCHVTGPLDRIIVVEDGPDIPADVRERFASRPIEWVSTGTRVGQIAAIDYAYSRVASPYVFHMEDDWLFYRSGFMERSLAILEANPKCLQVWIRALGDTQGHPVEPHTYVDHGVEWRRLAFGYVLKGEWHGFSFNPGLRRMQDYVSVGGFGRYIPASGGHGAPESALSTLYRRRDFYAAILSDSDGAGYVRHIGEGRRVPPAGTLPR